MDHRKIINASEIGQYAYCPRAWALARRGYKSMNRREIENGIAYHRQIGQKGQLVTVLWILLIFILLLLAVELIRVIR